MAIGAWKKLSTSSPWLMALLQKKQALALGAGALVLTTGLALGVGTGDPKSVSQPEPAAWADNTDVSTNVDPSFYKTPLAQEEVELQPRPEPEPEPEPEVELPEPDLPPAAEVFVFEEPKVEVDYAEQEFLEKSRQSSGILDAPMSADSFDPSGKGVWENSQDRWNEPRIEASYPVDMSRVFTTDRSMSCTLYNTIRSDLAGRIVLVVRRHLYGAHGRNILIPAGSKLVGYYEPLEKVGDERINVRMQRLITPDGIDIKLKDAEGGDAEGAAGLTGDVDTRFMQKYGLALGVAIVDAAVKYQIAVESKNAANVVNNIGTSTANLSRSLLDENINIKPRLTIPKATKVNVYAYKDIWFKKPKNGTIEIEEVK